MFYAQSTNTVISERGGGGGEGEREREQISAVLTIIVCQNPLS